MIEWAGRVKSYLEGQKNGWLIHVGALATAYVRELNGLGALINDQSAHMAS